MSFNEKLNKIYLESLEKYVNKGFTELNTLYSKISLNTYYNLAPTARKETTSKIENDLAKCLEQMEKYLAILDNHLVAVDLQSLFNRVTQECLVSCLDPNVEKTDAFDFSSSLLLIALANDISRSLRKAINICVNARFCLSSCITC